MVNPLDDETTVWKVCRVGREIRADWFVTQMCLTESNVLANTIRCYESQHAFICAIHLQCAYLISKTSLEHWSILLRPFLRNKSMTSTQLEQISEERNARNLWKALDLWNIR